MSVARIFYPLLARKSGGFAEYYMIFFFFWGGYLNNYSIGPPPPPASYALSVQNWPRDRLSNDFEAGQ